MIEHDTNSEINDWVTFNFDMKGAEKNLFKAKLHSVGIYDPSMNKMIEINPYDEDDKQKLNEKFKIEPKDTEVFLQNFNKSLPRSIDDHSDISQHQESTNSPKQQKNDPKDSDDQQHNNNKTPRRTIRQNASDMYTKYFGTKKKPYVYNPILRSHLGGSTTKRKNIRRKKSRKQQKRAS
jgi:hypothetical protein